MDTWSIVGVISSLVVSVISIVSVVWLAGSKIAKIEVKVDTIWTFLMRRAFLSAVEKGLGSLDSPFTPAEESKEYFTEIKDKLRSFYEKNKHKSDEELLMQMEAELGNVIVDKICLPYKMNRGECLVLALSVAKNEPLQMP